MKKYLFAGLLTMLPFALTLIVILWVFDLLTTPFLDTANYILLHVSPQMALFLQSHETFAKMLSRLLVLVLLLGLTLLLGVLGRRYFFNPLIQVLNKLFLRIPIVKVVYSLTKDFSKSMFAENQKPFKETALVPFIQGDSQTIGLVTGSTPTFLKDLGLEADVAVFVPTAPHPISGYILFYPKSLVKTVNVTTEDAFKFIITCGASSEHLIKK